MSPRTIAASFALIGFATAIVAGLAVDNPTATVLWRAIGAMLLCYAVGSLLGAMAFRLMTEHIKQYKAAHPIKRVDSAAILSGAAAASEAPVVDGAAMSPTAPAPAERSAA